MTGAVVRAGVYRLKDGQRIEDAIKLAGGVTEIADIASVNFAKKCRDGMQIDVKEKSSKPLSARQIREQAELRFQIRRMGIINDAIVKQYRPIEESEDSHE